MPHTSPLAHPATVMITEAVLTESFRQLLYTILHRALSFHESVASPSTEVKHQSLPVCLSITHLHSFPGIGLIQASFFFHPGIRI